MPNGFLRSGQTAHFVALPTTKRLDICKYAIALLWDAAPRTAQFRHLLSHTSGLPAEYTPNGTRDENILETELRAAIPTLELASMPGEGKYLYSNWGIRLASLIAERVSGEKFSRLAKEYVLEPLGMSDTTFDLHSVPREELSYPHELTDEGKLSPIYNISENYARLAAGGLWSNVLDLSRLARLILRGGVGDDGRQIICPADIFDMMTQHAKAPTGDGYGLTMQFHATPAGNITYGHYGNATPYTSAMFACPTSGIAVSVLINTYRENLRRDIADMVIDEVAAKRHEWRD